MTQIIPGEIRAFTQLPDTDGVWHLIAQVQDEDGRVQHGTLHVLALPDDVRGDHGLTHGVGFQVRTDLDLAQLPAAPAPVPVPPIDHRVG